MVVDEDDEISLEGELDDEEEDDEENDDVKDENVLRRDDDLDVDFENFMKNYM